MLSGVTSDDFWKRVSEQLLLRRTRKGWNPIDVDRAGGPGYGTVQEVDRGHIATITTLNKYAKALGLTVPDLFSAVLNGGDETGAEVAKLARVYRDATVDGRAALVALARALEEKQQAGAPEATPTERPVPVESGRRRRG